VVCSRSGRGVNGDGVYLRLGCYVERLDMVDLIPAFITALIMGFVAGCAWAEYKRRDQ